LTINQAQVHSPIIACCLQATEKRRSIVKQSILEDHRLLHATISLSHMPTLRRESRKPHTTIRRDAARCPNRPHRSAIPRRTAGAHRSCQATRGRAESGSQTCSSCLFPKTAAERQI